MSAEDASDSEDEGSEPVTNTDPNQTNPVPKETPEETQMLPCIFCGNDYKVRHFLQNFIFLLVFTVFASIVKILAEFFWL